MEKIIQLRRLTTFDLGGAPLRYFCPGDADELCEALDECAHAGLPWRVLGGGSNLLIEDGQLPFAVIHTVGAGFDRIERTGPYTVRAGAGVRTARLLATCKEAGLGGLEFLAGLPGTVGGAVAGNAGAWGRQTAEAVSRLWVLRPDRSRTELARGGIAFGYRQADLAGAIITEAEFTLPPRDAELVARQMEAHARARAERHPMGERSAGCIFKNPPGRSAGRMLDACSLKGYRVGGAEVSRMHANFILNRGGAASSDVLSLVARMRAAVRWRFGVELQLEVKHWPAEPRVA